MGLGDNKDLSICNVGCFHVHSHVCNYYDCAILSISHIHYK